MKKKGFTLIELIISIAIISIGGACITFVLLNKKSNNEENKTLNKLISAASVYLSIETDEKGNTYETGLLSGGTGVTIPIKVLKESGYINDSLIKSLEKNNSFQLNTSYLLAAIFSDDSNECSGEVAIEFKPSWTTNISNNKPTYICPYASNKDVSQNDEDVPSDIESDLAKKVFEQYKYSVQIPDFSKKSPGSNGKYRYVEIDWTNTNNWSKAKSNYTYKPFNYNKTSVDDTRELGDYNYKIYFGSSFTFDEETGYFTLTDTDYTYMDDAYNTGKYYVCDDAQETQCKIMYKINSWDDIWNSGTSDRWGYDQKTTTGIKYKSVDAFDKGDSGLYRHFDEDGYTYYFRGVVDNNYVKLNGSNELFQIVRFNGDGSVRLVAVYPVKEDGNVKKIIYDGRYEYEKDLYDMELSSTETTHNYNYKNSDFIKSPNYYGFKICDNLVFSGSTTSGENCNFVSTTEIKNNPDNYKNKYVFFTWYQNGSTSYSIGNAFSPSGYYQITGYNNYILSGKKVTKVTNKIIVDSELKQTLNVWYNQNSSIYDNYTIQGKFCVSKKEKEETSKEWIIDTIGKTRLTYGNIYAVNPTFKCNKASDNLIKGGQFNSKVGTLTADDIVFAGVVPGASFSDFDQRNSNALRNEACRKVACDSPEGKIFADNKDFYLYREHNFYTLNGFPFVNDGFSTASNCNDYCTLKGQYLLPFINNYAGNIGYSSNYDMTKRILYKKGTDQYLDFAVYPVINVKSNLKVSSGDGSKTNPYILTN